MSMLISLILILIVILVVIKTVGFSIFLMLKIFVSLVLVGIAYWLTLNYINLC